MQTVIKVGILIYTCAALITATCASSMSVRLMGVLCAMLIPAIMDAGYND